VPTHVTQYSVENGVEIAIDAQIVAGTIHWTRSEHLQSYEGEAWTEDQSFEDFLDQGPSELAAGLSEEKRREIERLVRGA
jgi:hypothetical protein